MKHALITDQNMALRRTGWDRQVEFDLRSFDYAWTSRRRQTRQRSARPSSPVPAPTMPMAPHPLAQSAETRDTWLMPLTYNHPAYQHHGRRGSVTDGPKELNALDLTLVERGPRTIFSSDGRPVPRRNATAAKEREPDHGQ